MHERRRMGGKIRAMDVGVACNVSVCTAYIKAILDSGLGVTC
jgi:hypothetical protein